MPEFATAQDAMGFVTDQTYRINSEVYAIQYPELAYEEFLPVNTSGPEWGKGVISYVSSGAGEAAWFAGGADDMRLAEVRRGKIDTQFEMAGIGYQYNLEEINTAALVPGTNLSNQKAEAARFGSKSFLYDIAITGDAAKGMVGLINAALVVAGFVPADGAANSRLWSAKNADLIVRDVNGTLTGIWTGSNTVEMADTLLLSPSRMLFLAQTRLDQYGTETLLAFIMRTNVYTLTTGRPLMVRAVRQLETAGAGGSQRMVAYRRDPRVVEFHLPMPHKFMPVWQNGPLNFVIPGIFRTGGNEIKRPNAMRYADGF